MSYLEKQMPVHNKAAVEAAGYAPAKPDHRNIKFQKRASALLSGSTCFCIYNRV